MSCDERGITASVTIFGFLATSRNNHREVDDLPEHSLCQANRLASFPSYGSEEVERPFIFNCSLMTSLSEGKLLSLRTKPYYEKAAPTVPEVDLYCLDEQWSRLGIVVKRRY